MPESEILTWLYKIAPALCVVVWVMIQQERRLNRIIAQYDEIIKTAIAAINKNTETAAATGVHLAQASELYQKLINKTEGKL